MVKQSGASHGACSVCAAWALEPGSNLLDGMLPNGRGLYGLLRRCRRLLQAEHRRHTRRMWLRATRLPRRTLLCDVVR